MSSIISTRVSENLINTGCKSPKNAWSVIQTKSYFDRGLSVYKWVIFPDCALMPS